MLRLNRYIVRIIAACATCLLAFMLAIAAHAQDADFPDAPAQSSPPAPRSPTTTRDPRGDYSGTATSSRFQRKVPVPTPVASAPAVTSARPAQPAAVTPNSRPLVTTAPTPITSKEATPAQTSANVAQRAQLVRPSALEESTPTTSAPIASEPLPSEPPALPRHIAPPTTAIADTEEDRAGNLLWIGLAIFAACIVAGLAVAKLLMPWPRPRVSCRYEIIPQELAAGTLALQAPDIQVSAQSVMGESILSGALTN